jgi:3-oxoacyl-[acyl-carrier-protein] synthase II
VVAAKANFGNLGAGSGLVELIASIEALRRDRLFPALNYRHPDPRCPLHVVTAAGQPPGQTCLNVNVTPQGQAAAVVVRKWS